MRFRDSKDYIKFVTRNVPPYYLYKK